MSGGKFSQFVKAGCEFKFEVILHEHELELSSLVNKSALKGTELALGARSKSAILHDPKFFFHP